MKDWLTTSWRERFIPERMRTVDDQIFSDPNGLSLIKESEAILDKIIAHMLKNGPIRGSQVYKKNGRTFKLRLKVSQKHVKLLTFDTHVSPSAIKKRFVLSYTRSEHSRGSQKMLKEGSVYYMKNGKSHVRSIMKSPYFHGIIQKMQHIDGAMDGHAPTSFIDPPIPEESPKASKEVQTEQDHYTTSLNYLTMQKHDLPEPIQNRLQQLLERLNPFQHQLRQLSVEDRYQVKRMAQEDIPNLISAYKELDNEEQEEQMPRIYEALTKMELVISKLEENDEQLKNERFDYLIRLNERRYTGGNDADQ
ncbi:hypothetical protein [Geomicrobium sp. JCM 19038]|uniref:hypothetical protein n=1 Tax=Geomicrobium sp. JCM 19038 TaxID=1460635 RepID=UPI0005A73E15|nr:hypothetical protein [Geomicrobium sp. JCM 19038]